MKARLLADAEEQEAKRLTLVATEALLEKVQRKLQLFDAMAKALRSETAAVEVSFGFTLWTSIAESSERCFQSRTCSKLRSMRVACPVRSPFRKLSSKSVVTALLSIVLVLCSHLRRDR